MSETNSQETLTLRRRDVTRAQQRRGKSFNNIWRGYTRTGRDWTCWSNPDYAHLCWLENDGPIENYLEQATIVVIEIDDQSRREE